MAHQRGRHTSNDLGRLGRAAQNFDGNAGEPPSHDRAGSQPNGLQNPAFNPFAANPFESFYFQSTRAIRHNQQKREIAELRGEAAAPDAQRGYQGWLNGYGRNRPLESRPAPASAGADQADGKVEGDYSGDMDSVESVNESANESPVGRPEIQRPSDRPGFASGAFDAHIGRPVDPFARSGPKGYVRTDARLQEEICEALIARPRLDLVDVTVTVADGKVMLDGSVPDRHTRFEIEDVVEDTWGVKQVDNRLRVRQRDGRASVAPPDSLQ